jgi:tetratricopeptide (TPR) repeat protein
MPCYLSSQVMYLLCLMSCVLSLFAQFQSAAPPQKGSDDVYVQIITVKTQAELDQILTLLRNQNFSDAARTYSTHSSASTNGIWGPVRLDQLAPEVREKIENASEGTLVQFFDPALGFTIFRKLNSISAKKSLFQLALSQGEAHLQRHENKEALKELGGAVALDPRSGAAHQLLGQAQLTQGTYEAIGEAKSEFVQALALNPDLIWARFYLARIYLDLGNAERAKEELELGLHTRPNVPHLLSLLGEANRQLGNPTLSAEQNKRALEADPSFFVAHYYLGLAYLDLRKEEEGIRELETAAKSDAPIPDIYLSLGSIYVQKGDLDGAIELFKKAVAAAPSRPEGHLRLGQAYRLKKMTALALQELALAFPDGARVLNTAYYQTLQADTFFEQGLIYQEMGEESRAIEAYSKVLDLDPARGNVHRQLAEVLFRQGQYQQALEHATKADELKTPVAPVLFEQIIRSAKSASAQTR